MSTEHTFYNDDRVDLFINEDMIDGSVIIYSNYLKENSAYIELNNDALKALVEFATTNHQRSA